MDINKRSKLNFSVILLALFLAVALGLAVYGLYRLGLVQLPALRFEDAMPSGDSEEIEKLIESLANSEQIGEVDYRMLDSSVVIDVLATGRASNTYLHEYTVTYSDAEKGTLRAVWQKCTPTSAFMLWNASEMLWFLPPRRQRSGAKAALPITFALSSATREILTNGFLVLPSTRFISISAIRGRKRDTPSAV